MPTDRQLTTWFQKEYFIAANMNTWTWLLSLPYSSQLLPNGLRLNGASQQCHFCSTLPIYKRHYQKDCALTACLDSFFMGVFSYFYWFKLQLYPYGSIHTSHQWREHKVDVAPDTPVTWVLRDHLGLVGTKYGCGIAQCGACTVHFDGAAVRSCVLPVSSVETSKITTIEGLSENGDHPLQVAWNEVDVPQCGYCQAGQIMTAAAFLKETPHPPRTK